MAEQPIAWGALWALVSNLDGQDYTLTGETIPGAAALTREQLQTIHLSVVLALTLGSIFSRLARDCLSPAFTSFSDRARALSQGALQLEDTHNSFRALPRTGHHTPAQYSTILANRDELQHCQATRNWGPSNEQLKDLCSPAFLMFLIWVGSPIVDPILELQYAFALDQMALIDAWLDCPTPYVNQVSFTAIGYRIDAIRGDNRLRTPAQQLANIAERATETMTALLRVVLAAATGCINISGQELFIDNIIKPTFAAVVSTAVPMLPSVNPAAPCNQQVSSELPATSSLPAYLPNFSDDTNPQWFRSATYHFSNLAFPLESLSRGDASAEHVWHEYTCNVLRVRILCMHLSEQQVITHLSQSFKRADPHFVASEELRCQPSCTLLLWLSGLRDFFFTNQQFRHNIELAWRKYRVGTARDFNELIHHIRTYYQLIFLDYNTLPGKMTLYDFAWHLFEKIQHLLSPECKSELARVVQQYVPLAGVLERMQTCLRVQAMHSLTLEADPAYQFVTWCIAQLRTARETANTTRRYATLPDPRVTTDFARLHPNSCTTPTPAPPGTRSTSKPTRIALANSDASNRADAISKGGKHLQNRTIPARHDPSRPLDRTNLPTELKDSLHRRGPPLTEADIRGLLHRLPPWMAAMLTHELDHPGQPDTLHGVVKAYVNAKKPTYRLPATALTICLALLKSYLIHARPMCLLCPHDSTCDRRHFVDACPEVLQHCRPALEAFRANVANAGKGFLAVQPGQPIPQDVVKPRKDRYAPPSGAPPPPAAPKPGAKRERPAHIR